jgi:hypothetical protein
MTIAPKGLGSELGLHIRDVWMGSSQAVRDAPEDLSYAPVVIAFRTIQDGHPLNCLYPLNPDQAPQMRDKLRSLAEERPKPKTAGERYKARKSAKGLHFKFDDDIGGIFVADVNASFKGLGADAAGSLSFKSQGLDGVVCVAFSREEFAMFADVVARAIDAFEAPPEASA